MDRAHLRRTSLRRLMAALLVLLPVLLGPLTMPLVRALGGLEAHHCACGMQAGKCGCAECERLEEQRRQDAELLRGQAVLRSSCDDGHALPGACADDAIMPASVAVPAAAFDRLEHPLSAPDLGSRDRARPPIPPPRSTRV